ncbi:MULTISPECIES: hypothetical protein [Comamonas]|jgi:hypothetical protein|uniref:Uncharacterized protein n=1 Tax=Comamonas squillarum TaxID=2977320 RepID=A0ABY6A250_9BURK|nr:MULTISPECIES: hypothetical protein [Comamonas]UXC19085.1 hypothetical protein N4T19_02865 [Comamonas sp. PR12]
MLVADALRALAPFSLVAGLPWFQSIQRAIVRSNRRRPGHGAANDGQLAAQVHCFATASSAAVQRGAAQQLSLLDGPVAQSSVDTSGADTSCMDTPRVDSPADGAPVQRPIDRIRLPRKPAARRRLSAAAQSHTRPFLSVQRCSAQAANDAPIKMYWAQPASLHRQKGMRWAMSGSMADICAELERLERLEHLHAV